MNSPGTAHTTKKVALRLMRSCGIFAAARAMSAPMARILMYHNFAASSEDPNAVSVDALRHQFEYLRRHFSIVPLRHIIDRLKMGAKWQNHVAALTIDDGRRNCYEVMFPLLREFEIPATFFIVSSFISGQDWIWTDKVLWLSEQPHRPSELDPEQLDGFFRSMNQLRPGARTTFIDSIAKRMGVTIPLSPPPKYAPCSWRELREMAYSDLVEIGSHSISHPIFANLTDGESWQELVISRTQIEEGIGRKVRYFCFPNGQLGDYRPSQLRQVRDAGYEGAVAAHAGMVSTATDPYKLPRIGVSGKSDMLSFSKQLDGADHYQIKIQKLFGLA